MLTRDMWRTLYSSLWVVFVPVWVTVEPRISKLLRLQEDLLRFLLLPLRNHILMISILPRRLPTIQLKNRDAGIMIEV